MKMRMGVDGEGNIIQSNILVKVAKMKYLQPTLAGELFLGTLEKYRKMNQNGVGDEEEGLVGVCEKGTMFVGKKTVADVKDLKWYLGKYPVFCTLIVKFNRVSENRFEFTLPRKFLEEFMYDSDAKYGLMAINREEFYNNVKRTLEEKEIVGFMGEVNYTDELVFYDKDEAYKAAFRKRLKFKHQSEYRLFLDKTVEGDHFYLNIGDMSEYAQIFRINNIDDEIKIGVDFNAVYER